MSDSQKLHDNNPTSEPPDPTFNLSNFGEPLTEEDFHSLERSSWIDRQTAIAAGLRRVDRFSGADMVARKDAAKKTTRVLFSPTSFQGNHTHIATGFVGTFLTINRAKRVASRKST